MLDDILKYYRLLGYNRQKQRLNVIINEINRDGDIMKVFNVNFNIETFSLKNLIQFAETESVTDDIFNEYLAVSLLEDENVLSKVCEETDVIGNSLKSAAFEDLNTLWDTLSKNPLRNYNPSLKHKIFFKEYQSSLETVVSSSGPSEMLENLITHYSAFGSGKNAKYIAFRWQGEITGIKQPDDITLERLFCLDFQKEILIENTSLFLRGLPANNALLYGTSGSGKSAMIKALLNKYYNQGLRLVEIPKEKLEELPQLVNCIKNKRLKYIIFMDDLSFETGDTGYKILKVILDGRIEKQPENILFYATSNRFHIINETWKDREGDEIHLRDTMSEKLSLSERFGIRVNFVTSSISDDYFKIIEGILSTENIQFTEEIRKEATHWETLYNGRSGRTAAQFAKTIIAGLSDSLCK
jgi:predicted AAA+ superfamily ATPase